MITLNKRLFIILSLISVFILSCSQTHEEKRESTPSFVIINPNVIELSQEIASTLQMEPVKLHSKEQQRLFSGKIQYDDDRGRSSKISSPVVGRVIDIRAKLGEHVSAGDILLVIESQDIGTAYSDYLKADSDYLTARRALELAKDLYEGKGIAKKDLQQAENDEQKARAEFFRAKERLLNLHVSPEDLDRPVDQQKIRSSFFLRSPLTGIVVERNVTPGQIVGNDPSQTLFTIANLSTVVAVADLSDKDLTRISLGNNVEINADSYPEVKFTGKITYISDLVDPATRSFKFRCRIENKQGLLKPEMFVRILVTTGQTGKELPAVPASAIVHEGERNVVFIRTQKNRFLRRQVSFRDFVYLEPENPLVLIQEGLQPGEEVVTQGGLLLENLLTNPT